MPAQSMFVSTSEDETIYCEALDRLLADAAPVPRVQALDNEKTFDVELHQALAGIGAWGIGVDEALGGSGGGPVLQVLTLERLGRHATSMAVFGVIQYMATRLLRQFGADDQWRRYLDALCAGRICASFCMTEAGGGTDILASLTTRATRTADGWCLQGTKYWISGASRADLLIVVARTSAHRSRGITLFLVPSSTRGVTTTVLDTFAINGYDTCEVGFDDVRLPADAVLGTVDQGFMQVLGTLNSERLNAAAVAAGIGRGAHQLALSYAKERAAFGRPIGQFQALQHKLVHAGVDLEAAWAMTVSAARLEEQGRDVSVESAVAKLAASGAGQRAAELGMGVVGGAAFDVGFPMQRYYRDIRLYSFAPLTDDMIANFLGERWLGLPRSY
ncbi:MAG: acyl-CoA dehydrogenase family protein [Gammaproteobacteria bacterium]